MNRDFYTDIHFSSANNAYLFSSTGPRGNVPKIVIFQKLSQADVFNLFLSDYCGNNIADDQHITNNGDMPKVLATVVHIIHKFTEERPGSQIVITGSDTVRKRLYARILFNNHEALQKAYDVSCTDSFDIPYEPYEPTDKNRVPYSFLIRRKQPNFKP